MKYYKSALLLLLALGMTGHVMAKGGGHSGSHHVSGYVTKNGTYVQPHHATNPNNTRTDNWSHVGNVNPYTGKVGTKN